MPVANTEMAEFAGQKVLIVERFDRAWMDGGKWIARLPQEDFCQALGYPPDKKYERDGGPRNGGMPAASRRQRRRGRSIASSFQLSQLAFWLMAATDGHAKNFSLFLLQGDAYAMTPLYDVISIWPYIGDGAHQFRWRSAGLAMALRAKNAHYALHTLQARHWHALAMKNGGPPDVASDARTGRSGRVGARHRRVAPSAVLSGAEPGTRSRTGMRSQARLFESGRNELGH